MNNAGTEGKPSPVTEQTAETYSATFDTNVLGVLLSMKHELRVMQAQGSGSIVNLSSTMGQRGAPVASLYRQVRSPLFLVQLPRRVVPTLVLDDGTATGEVPAIVRYLEEIHPEPPLLGATPKTKALVTMWERRVELEGFASLMEAVRNAVPGLKNRAIAGRHDYEQIPAPVERSERRVRNFHIYFNGRLADVRFVAGDECSVADITAVVTIELAAKSANLPMADEHTALKRWYDVVSARPSMGGNGTRSLRAG